MLEIKDLAGVSKPLEKLIDTLRAGAGLLYEPLSIKRRSLANAEARIAEAKADIEIESLRHRAEVRQKFSEERRQLNAERISLAAAKYLPSEVAADKVDPDWVFSFFEECADTSNEDLQGLWAKILAGEIARPGSASKRLLRIVRLMDRRDAASFTNLCSFMVETNLTVLGFPIGGRDYLPLGPNAFDLIALDGLGLLTFHQQLTTTLAKGNQFRYFDKTFTVVEANSGNVVPYQPLTREGIELRKACQLTPSPAFRPAIEEFLKARANVTILWN